MIGHIVSSWSPRYVGLTVLNRDFLWPTRAAREKIVAFRRQRRGTHMQRRATSD